LRHIGPECWRLFPIIAAIRTAPCIP
jgi:hypothetical protein